jgi:CysZ protein
LAATGDFDKRWAMLTALVRALVQLYSPPLRRVLALSIIIAVASFIVLWLGVAVALAHLPSIGWQPLDWLLHLIGFAGVLLLSWLLFPAVVTMTMGFFLERVAAAVESLDYPGRGPPRRQSIRESVVLGLRLMALGVALNLLALPAYVLAPGINVFVFLGLNGYLFGREYFEVVALRRLDIDAAKAMRHRYGGRVFAGGVMIAGIFVLPFVNLAAPVIATAFMVHLFEGLPRLAPAGAVS